MTDGFWQKLDRIGRSLTPFSVTMMLMLVGMVPWYLPGYGVIAPELALMGIYYWAIHRPDLLRPSIAFLLGLIQDLLSGVPLGVNALVFVLVYWVVLSQRRFFLATTFTMLWWGFALIALGAVAAYWLVLSLLNLTLLPLAAPLVQAVLTIALFPLFASLFIRVHRAFLQPQ